MASRGSFIRSAARGTSSAYRRLPIRWRLAGGSALLTLVILLRLRRDRRRAHDRSRSSPTSTARWPAPPTSWQRSLEPDSCIDETGAPEGDPARTATPPTSRPTPPATTPSSGSSPRRAPDQDDARTRRTCRRRGRTRGVRRLPDRVPRRSRSTPIGRASTSSTRAGSPTSRRRPTASSVFLGLGVLGGAALALLAGLATATRAMAPITRLTDTARAIARTRDPSLRIPHPESEDEVAELARTLEGMLAALDEARARDGGGAAAPARVRGRRLARAAHAAHLRAGQPRAARGGARGRAARGGRVRPALLAPDAPARRRPAAARPRRRRARGRRTSRSTSPRCSPRRPGELEPVAGDHPSRSPPPPGAQVEGARDELHRLTLNLLENALRHTDPGTAVEATVERRQRRGRARPSRTTAPASRPSCRTRSSSASSAARATAAARAASASPSSAPSRESHRGDVRLEPPLDGRGARFVVRLPAP